MLAAPADPTRKRFVGGTRFVEPPRRLQWGISTSHDPRTDPDAPTRFLSRAERGSGVRGSDRSSVSPITNRRIDPAKASPAIESAETDPTRWNFAPGFQAAGRRARRNSYGQTVSLDRISIESTAREARSAARADSDARIPNPRDRSQPEKTPRDAGDADALAEGTASVPRARRAKARGARTAGCVLSRRHAMTISGTRLSASVRGLARAHLARRAGGRALGTRAAIRRIDTPHGGGGEKKGVTFKEPLDIDRSACVTGIMHVGVGGFHRAHQLVRDASSPSARRELPRARARRPRNPKERWMIPPKRSEHRPTRRIRQLSLDAGGAAASEPRDEEGASRPSAARNAERGNRSARYARLERSVPTAPAPLARVAAASRGPSRVTHEVQGRKRPSHPRFRPVHEEPAHVFFPASKLSPALAGSLPPGRLTLFPEPPLPRPRRRRTLLDQKKSPT